MASRLGALSIISTALAATVPHNFAKRDTFSWGSIGDSWTSGVAYSDDNAWDGNKDGCMRTKDAWSVQLAGDDSWSENPQDWIFNGCSGSVLGDMHGYGTGGRMLINGITNNPLAIFMSAGGNNAFFGEIVANCIYQINLSGYGPYYEDDTDCTGLCCQSLLKADNYINQQGDGGFYQDMLNTINDLMGTPQANGQDKFYLYINGYVQFFNEGPTGEGTCDDWSFNPYTFREDPSSWKQRVTQPLRKRMNDLVKNLNQVTQNAIHDWPFDFSRPTQQFVIYVDVDSFFQDHRFCEPGDSFENQWGGSNVWIWNLQVSNDQDPNVAGGVDVPDGSQLNLFGSGSDGPGAGWQSRPFHPKVRGHIAVKDAIIAAMRAHNMPGVKPAQPWVSGQCGFHLQEKWLSEGRVDGPAWINIPKLVDGAGNIIGSLPNTEIDNVEGVGMTSQLPYVVVINPWDSGEDGTSWNYYNLRFSYAGTTWTSLDSEGAAHCAVGAKDDGPGFGLLTQDMDCVFPC